jgi:hypothetical protein
MTGGCAGLGAKREAMRKMGGRTEGYTREKKHKGRACYVRLWARVPHKIGREHTAAAGCRWFADMC